MESAVAERSTTRPRANPVLNWLRRLIFNRHRAIFTYWDGTRLRAIDPIVAYRRLKSDPEFDDTVHLDRMEQGNLEALDVVLSATRRAFHLTEWTENQPGLTVFETRDLIVSFVLYLDALKKNGSLLQTSPAAMEPLPSRPPSASHGSVTSDSGLISNGRSPVAPSSI